MEGTIRVRYGRNHFCLGYRVSICFGREGGLGGGECIVCHVHNFQRVVYKLGECVFIISVFG